MNRKHELFLINLGLESLLSQMVDNKHNKKKVVRGKAKKKWTKAQHAKYAETMEKKWGQRRGKK